MPSRQPAAIRKRTLFGTRYNISSRTKGAMHAISLPDPLYSEAEHAAAASGLSVESFVVEAVRLYLDGGQDNLDHRFTPDVIAALDRAAAQADAGEVLTFEQYDREFQEKRDGWLREHASSK